MFVYTQDDIYPLWTTGRMARLNPSKIVSLCNFILADDSAVMTISTMILCHIESSALLIPTAKPLPIEIIYDSHVDKCNIESSPPV
jgi:hypothetical protein